MKPIIKLHQFTIHFSHLSGEDAAGDGRGRERRGGREGGRGIGEEEDEWRNYIILHHSAPPMSDSTWDSFCCSEEEGTYCSVAFSEGLVEGPVCVF